MSKGREVLSKGREVLSKMPLTKSYFTGSIFADNVIKNPFIISLFITVFALIIFYAVNSSKMIHQNVRDKIKSGFWLLIAVTILTSIHFFAVKKYFLSNSITQNLQDSVNLISNEAEATDVYNESIQQSKPDVNGRGEDNTLIGNQMDTRSTASLSDRLNRSTHSGTDVEPAITSFIDTNKLSQNAQSIINKLPSSI